MKIAITSRKVNLRDNFKERVEKKLSKFNRIFDEDAQANVTVTLEKNRQTVEVTIRQNGMVYRAEQTAEEMNDALDAVIDVLGRQIRKNKCRLEKKCALLFWMISWLRKSLRKMIWKKRNTKSYVLSVFQ